MALFEEGGDDEDKTEDPSPRRLEQALEQGNVPQSPELSGALQALAGAGALTLLGGGAWVVLQESLAGSLGRELTIAAGRVGTAAGARELAQEYGISAGRAALPLIGAICVASVAATMIQRRPYFNFDKLGFDFARLDPIANLGRAFKQRGMTGLVVTAVKVGLVVAVVRSTVLHALPRLAGLGGTGLRGSLEATGEFAAGLLLKGSLALVVAGVLDLLIARRAWLRSLRMSREELKREAREEDGDPALKGRMRSLQRQRRSKKRMLEDTKKADAVVTNPTHLAIALRYDRSTMGAPRVVAKGADHLAAEIRDVARQEGIPLLEDKPLARTLYRTVEVGGEVPPKLYQAVAEVLAFVYRMKKRAS